MSLTDERIDSIVGQLPKGLLDRIVTHLDPQRVIVFGSRATGEIHSDSDWDLLIVVDDDIPPERLNWRAIHEVRSGIRGAIDLIPCRASTFEERVETIGSLPWIAANKGVVVYERTSAN